MEKTKIQSYKDLVVWQKSMNLVCDIYELSRILPSEERFGISSQMKRSAVSIPSNIAEGKGRGSRKDYRQFVIIAYGSACELETQTEIALRLKMISKNEYQKVQEDLTEILKMLNKLIRSLE